jgi:hypothetical protein
MGGFLFQHIIFFFCTLFFLVTFLKLFLNRLDSLLGEMLPFLTRNAYDVVL